MISRSVTFGIVGGYGATGRAVINELFRSSIGDILIGGRDLNKGTALAAKLGTRVSAVQLNVLEPRSLDDFCSRCRIIVNCAGPVALLQDRVAQAALRTGCHYVDVAGLLFVKQRMRTHSWQAAQMGLSFVISAGWMPGISELVPAYAYAQARSQMDTVESVSVYFSDCGEWSDNALHDAAWFVHRAGLARPGYFHKGQRIHVKMSDATRRVNLGNPIGRGRFCLVSVPELDELGGGLTDCDVFIYSYLSGPRTVAAASLMALLPVPDQLAVLLLRNIFRRNKLPVDGFAVASVLGCSKGRNFSLTAQIVYRDQRGYWINGLVAATAARMISENKPVRRGVHFLASAVDPIAFMTELTKAGVEQTETFKSCSSAVEVAKAAAVSKSA